MSQTPDWQYQFVESLEEIELSSCHTALGLVENSTLLLSASRGRGRAAKPMRPKRAP